MTPIQLHSRAILTGAALFTAVAFLGSPVAAQSASGIKALEQVTDAKKDIANKDALSATPAPAPTPNPQPIHFEAGSRVQMLSDSRALIARAEQLSARYHPAPGGPSMAELQASMSQVKSDTDSLSEMGETEPLRLQMTMDRLSKLMSTLSNLLKKASDTDQSIIQNMK